MLIGLTREVGTPFPQTLSSSHYVEKTTQSTYHFSGVYLKKPPCVDTP